MKPVIGHLEILDGGFGFLRAIEDNFNPTSSDAFVPKDMIKKLNLNEGIFIEGNGIKSKHKNKGLILSEIKAINGIAYKKDYYNEPFQNLVSINPSERFTLTLNSDDLMGKALDMIVPIGKGQRGLVISPPKAGKTTILKHMANAMANNHADAVVFVLLIDERPEEVTDFKRGFKKANVLSSTTDQSISQHMRMTKLAMNTAMRYAEVGKDSVVLIDSLTRISRAFNAETRNYGRTLSGGLGANALEIPRKIFGAARNIENGGSLTIIASILVETGSRMDDIIYQEFRGTGNMDLVLSRKCAEQRIFPAININQSGTRKENLLLNNKEYQEIVDIRRGLSQLDELTAMSNFLEYLNNKNT